MKKAKPCARAFRANCGKDFFFAAVAATTIRAILPFSLRLCEYFSYFQKLAYLLPFSLETSRYALVAKALHCKTAFSATKIELLKIRNTIDMSMSPRMLTSDKKFCARSILRAAYQQKLSQDPFVPFSLYNILCADNLQ